MDILYKLHQSYLNNLNITFRRDYLNKIDWGNRLLAVRGARGVGKSTLILQHITEAFGNRQEALYVSLDSTAIGEIQLYEVAMQHYENGGTHLFLDEIHKYENWSKAVKTIYDLIPQLHIVISGSSILHIHTSQADLSRRMVTYDLPGLSFREYLQIVEEVKLPSWTLEEVLEDHAELSASISKEIKVIPRFREYLEYGYYPFFLENISAYLLKLGATINQILEVDLPFCLGFDISNIFKIKKLVHHLASQVPFQPNISKLSGSMELSRSTLNNYIQNLEKACILNLLMDSSKSYSKISKPEKIFLNNTNLAHAIAPSFVNEGNQRETFFLNQLSIVHQVGYTKIGDFIVDEKYTFEIGGRNKNRKQIFDVPDAYIAADQLTTGMKDKVPLWLFGFLY